MKNNLCLFERPFKEKKNGVFLFWISSLFKETLRFLFKSWWRNKSSPNEGKSQKKNIGVIPFTNNVRQGRHKMTCILMLPWHLSSPVPFCYEPNVFIFDQIRRGWPSYLKYTKCPYCHTSPHQLIGSKPLLIKTKNENVDQAWNRPDSKSCRGKSTVVVILCLLTNILGNI